MVEPFADIAVNEGPEMQEALPWRPAKITQVNGPRVSVSTGLRRAFMRVRAPGFGLRATLDGRQFALGRVVVTVVQCVDELELTAVAHAAP